MNEQFLKLLHDNAGSVLVFGLLALGTLSLLLFGLCGMFHDIVVSVLHHRAVMKHGWEPEMIEVTTTRKEGDDQ